MAMNDPTKRGLLNDMQNTLSAALHVRAGKSSDQAKSAGAVVTATAAAGLAVCVAHPRSEVGTPFVLAAVLMALPLRHFSRPTSA